MIRALAITIFVWTALASVESARPEVLDFKLPENLKLDAATDSERLPEDDTPSNVLPPAQWRRVDDAVERGLAWLATQQQDDGSFPTQPLGQPAITSLCIMAFVAHGHVPGKGPYGDRLERATEFVLSCQKQNGLVMLLGPDEPRINRNIEHQIGSCGAYNHAISSLMLSEIYGMSPPTGVQRFQTAINRSVAASLEMQHWPKEVAADEGGWRYIDDFEQIDSDLSVTGWQLMFLRSARNAGFNVPKERIDEAVAYVRRSFDPNEGVFRYSKRRETRTRSMNGAGILALAHAGFHHSEEARRAGDWLLQHGFGDYNATLPGEHSDRYHYGVFTCCQAMYQLGGTYWKRFFPPAVEAMLANQQADGSWPIDSQFKDYAYGNAYSTSLVVLTLGAPNQLLPVFQR
jgi:hypothetical protein